MKYFLSGDSLAEASADAVVGFVFEEPNSAAAELWDALTGGLAGELFARGEFKGKLHSTARIHRPAGMQAGQLLLIGCGPQEKFSSVLLRECAGRRRPRAARLRRAQRSDSGARRRRRSRGRRGILGGPLRAGLLQDRQRAVFAHARIGNGSGAFRAARRTRAGRCRRRGSTLRARVGQRARQYPSPRAFWRNERAPWPRRRGSHAKFSMKAASGS